MFENMEKVVEDIIARLLLLEAKTIKLEEEIKELKK